MTEDISIAYEGMFLFPQSQMGNLQAALDHLKDILRRGEAELISMRKWDERRLAYEIKGNKRGVYFLAYFKAPPMALRRIERSCNLSEMLLRSMITRADHLARDQMEAADGAAELADEIKLRAQESAAEAARADRESPDQPDDSPEPITVETESGSKDPAAT